MLKYLQFGSVPPRRHIAHYDDGQLLHEYCFTRAGFEQSHSTLYLYNPPTGETFCEAYAEVPWANPVKRENPLLQRRHFKSRLFSSQKNFISGRTILAFNQHLRYGLCRPQSREDSFFANNDGDELFFLFAGTIEVQSLFGKLQLTAGDYLVIPRSCPYRFVFPQSPQLLYIEAKGQVRIPQAYCNDTGQLNMDAPYSERSFKTPAWDDFLFENDGATTIIRKRQEQFTKTVYEKNFFKMTGWDGYVYPLALNLKDIQPKTGRIHLPPSSHMTFAGDGFAVMSFLPRILDFDKQAVPCPFYHSSVNCDELLFYHSGNFTSRKNIGKGSISFHPSGIPHGPHPGAYEKSIGLTATEEEAVMVDTFDPLFLTKESRTLEDPDYPTSWREEQS